MGNKELVMVDESNEEITERHVAIVISDVCMLNGNVITVPLNEALSIAANITVQASMLV